MLELFVLFICSLIVAGMLIWLGRSIVFAIPVFHGAVFVPTDDHRLKQMVELAQVKKGEKVVDLGSGDGKLLFAFAKQGVKVDGFEINPILVRRTRKKITELGLEKQVKVFSTNLWKADLSKYDVVTTYLTYPVMKRLEEKLKVELRPKARIVSNYFQFPTLKVVRKKGQVRLYKL